MAGRKMQTPDDLQTPPPSGIVEGMETPVVEPESSQAAELEALNAPTAVFAPPPTFELFPGGVPDLDAAIRHGFPPVQPEGVKIRFGAQVYDPEGKAYFTWPGVRWQVNVHSVDQATRLREAMTEFLQLWVAGEQPQP